MANSIKSNGYLPNDSPTFWQMILLASACITMFPATVLCAMLMGFPVSTVLTVTGFGTVVALVGAKLSMGKYIPLYYGSCFAYLLLSQPSPTNIWLSQPTLNYSQLFRQASSLRVWSTLLLVWSSVTRWKGKRVDRKYYPPLLRTCCLYHRYWFRCHSSANG